MEKTKVIIIGGGQAGLVMGYFLSKLDIKYIILEKGSIAQSWRDRYDSLHLITPKDFSNLPGLSFPDNVPTFPAKGDVIEYLLNYARFINAPIREHCTVLKVEETKYGSFQVETDCGIFQADQVVVASGYLQRPHVPPFADLISKQIIQIHSDDYKSPGLIHKGVTLVVGAANTGISIARELANDRKVYLAQGKLKRFPRTLLGKDIFWWVQKLGVFKLNVKSKLGQKVSKKMIASGDATYGLFPRDIAKTTNIELTSRIVDASNAAIFCEDQKMLTDVEVIIWSTGYKPDYASWIRFDVFDDKGIPKHDRGTTSVPGLYFLGLKWQYTIASFLLHGVGQDAAYLAGKIKEMDAKNQYATKEAAPRKVASLKKV